MLSSAVAATSTQPEVQICPICQVKIQAEPGSADQVMFSRGTPGTRSKLWSRVCQFLRTEEQISTCLNQDPHQRGTEQAGDAFPDAPTVDLGQP